MDSRTFKHLCDLVDTIAEEQLGVKGIEYPTSDDRLSNFYDTARIADLLLGSKPIRINAGVVALIFSLKHFIPVLKYSMGQEIHSESPISKAADLQNYVKLMFAIGEQEAVSHPRPQDGCESPLTGEATEAPKYVGIPGYFPPEALAPDNTCITCAHAPELCVCVKVD